MVHSYGLGARRTVSGYEGTRSAMHALCAALASSSSQATLATLRLGRNELGRDAALALANGLKGAAALTELDLSGCGGGHVIARVAPAVLGCSCAARLQTLGLSGNKLRRPDVCALLCMLGGVSGLTSLSLARCGLRP